MYGRLNELDLIVFRSTQGKWFGKKMEKRYGNKRNKRCAAVQMDIVAAAEAISDDSVGFLLSMNGLDQQISKLLFSSPQWWFQMRFRKKGIFEHLTVLADALNQLNGYTNIYLSIYVDVDTYNVE